MSIEQVRGQLLAVFDRLPHGVLAAIGQRLVQARAAAAAEWHGSTSPHAHHAQECLAGVGDDLAAAGQKLRQAGELLQQYMIRL
ncbi:MULTISPECIES: hypothetical protein [Actinoalloteichus]|uniref:Uncharacterized protein n=1 Tax=Actinoalloteichus fjordicus TaxID=1612552 RepID=A0AAC9LBD5_9PSEU|nr:MULTISPECIES: hypothetical protein [Actinoalloteichus]APU14476.1 hypothetical protein UA74_12080 [Actinoalloteichus fjordicus]APU20445.1 hypothetical protein UA75_12165 [Actinoalloteichus sp. GBA129-24]